MNSRVVMLVEDDPDLLDGICEILRQGGLNVLGVRNFETARSYLERWRPAALVTDVRLGAYNGLHLVILAKQRSPDLEVFVYSGHPDPHLRAEAESYGAIFTSKDQVVTVLVPALLMRLGQVH